MVAELPLSFLGAFGKTVTKQSLLKLTGLNAFYFALRKPLFLLCFPSIWSRHCHLLVTFPILNMNTLGFCDALSILVDSDSANRIVLHGQSPRSSLFSELRFGRLIELLRLHSTLCADFVYFSFPP